MSARDGSVDDARSCNSRLYVHGCPTEIEYLKTIYADSLSGLESRRISIALRIGV